MSLISIAAIGKGRMGLECASTLEHSTIWEVAHVTGGFAALSGEVESMLQQVLFCDREDMNTFMKQ